MVQKPVVHRGDRRWAGEGQLAGKHLVENHAHGINVGAAVAALAFHLLRRDVVRRAEGGGEVGIGEAARRGVAGDAEVDQLDVVVVVDHDVFRLQVAVDDAVGVDVVERLKNAEGDVDGAVMGNAALVENLAQKAALAPLHDHVDTRTLFAAIDAHYVWVVKLFADAGLALEAVGENRDRPPCRGEES